MRTLLVLSALLAAALAGGLSHEYGAPLRAETVFAAPSTYVAPSTYIAPTSYIAPRVIYSPKPVVRVAAPYNYNYNLGYRAAYTYPSLAYPQAYSYPRYIYQQPRIEYIAPRVEYPVVKAATEYGVPHVL